VNAVHGRPLSEAEVRANATIVQASLGGRTRSLLGRGYDTARERLERTYHWLVRQRWFRLVVGAGFVATAILQAATIAALFVRRNASTREQLPILEQLSWLAASACIIVGVLLLRRNRLSAYRWFRRSTLITIFVTQVFMFYYSELAALGGLAWHLLVLFTLRFAIQSEERGAAHGATTESEPA
jgi:hypothetical protein